MSSGKVKVQEVLSSDKNSHTPVLLNFQNGILNKDSTDSVFYFETLNKTTKEKSAVLATRDGNLYRGNIKKSNGLTKTFIAIKDKRTNKVRLIQIDAASMINEIYNEKHVNETKVDSDELNKRLLIKNFGGRRAIIAHERDERMKVNVDIVKEQLNKTIETAEIDDESHKAWEGIDLSKIRPPLNENAKAVSDVYTITDIIPKDILDRLNDECYAVLESDIESIPISSEFILSRIKNIQESENPTSADNLINLKVCLYLDALINLIKTRQRIMNKIELSKITEKIENHIRENFSDPNSRIRTKTKFSTDKALCYSITLALLISENYEIEIDTLSKELSAPKPKVLRYARLVNGQRKCGTDIIRLQLPGTVKTNLIVKKRVAKTK